MRISGLGFALMLVLGATACSGGAHRNGWGALALGPLVPPPIGARIYRVPSSISSDCSRDVSVQLTRFLASVPPTSTVVFRAGGCYSQTTSIVLSDRSRLTIDGAGSRFKKISASMRGESGAESRPNWRIAGGDGITLQNMVIAGAYKNVPNSPNQFDSGVSIWGARRVMLKNLSITSVDGDLITADPNPRRGASLAAATPSRDITVEGLRGWHAARQGVAFTSTIGAVVKGSIIDDVQNGIDLEPDVPGEPVRDIRIEGNRFGKLAYTAVAAIPGASPYSDDVTIARNRMTVPPDGCYPAIAVGSDSAAPSSQRKDGYVVRENILLTRMDGVLLNGVASGTASGNEIVAVTGPQGCSSTAGAVPIRLVNSNVVVSDNASSGFRSAHP